MNIQDFINGYTYWLQQEISFEKCEEYFELTIPFLDRFNDYIQIYVKQEDSGKIEITDDGYIIENILSSGISLKNDSKCKQIFEMILHNHSLRLEGKQIVATATADDFPQKTHVFIQAMLALQTMLSMHDIFEQTTGV